jgi:uncharacterized protein (UPF0332 family)
MAFNWELYIDLSKELIEGQRGKGTPQEAHLRTAISRAYFGIYCLARNYLEEKGNAIPGKDSHKTVREAFLESGNKLGIQIGDALGRLFKKRKDADYGNDVMIDFSEATMAYQMAFRALQHLKIIINKPFLPKSL